MISFATTVSTPFTVSNLGSLWIFPSAAILTSDETKTGCRTVPPIFPTFDKVIVAPVRSVVESWPLRPFSLRVCKSAAISNIDLS